MWDDYEAEEAATRCRALRGRLRALSQHCAVFWVPLAGFYAVVMWFRSSHMPFARELALGLLAWGTGFVVVPGAVWGLQVARHQERSLGGVEPSDTAGIALLVLSGLTLTVGLARVWNGAPGTVEMGTAPLLGWMGTRTLAQGGG